MQNRFKKGRTYEAICIDKIELGINSIKNGHRDGNEVGSDLEYFFDKLEELNKPMFEDMYMKYCIARLEKEQSKELHS